ncbi:hypothetical protein SAT01_32690 [Sinomonas atrocyanea]|nr:hypothetical protein SAT01_32690 [Sinomonas atrocyanea]GGG61183.1 hypothetical protein GCM10007172_10280 [Sinomonas atrocyanea]
MGELRCDGASNRKALRELRAQLDAAAAPCAPPNRSLASWRGGPQEPRASALFSFPWAPELRARARRNLTAFLTCGSGRNRMRRWVTANVYRC